MSRPARPNKSHTVPVLYLPEQVREFCCCFLKKTPGRKKRPRFPDVERRSVEETREESLTTNPASMGRSLNDVKVGSVAFPCRIFTKLTKLLLKQIKYFFTDSLSAFATPIAQSGISYLGECHGYSH